MYTVREVAKLAHTTVKTLHYYHKLGLLIPEQTTEAGYRLYGKKDIERLQQILFYKELDFPLKEIQQLLDGETDRENMLIQQKYLLEQKIERFKGLVKTINSSIKSAKEGVDLDMETMFKGFESEEEWEEALKDQNEYLKKEYDFDLSNQTIDVEAMNDSAIEAQSFNEDMIRFLQEGFSANDPNVLDRVKEHLAFLRKKGHPSTPQDFLNQTEFFIADEFHRNMLEQLQTGYAYFLNKAAAVYLANIK
ncbi:MerR family transcriptional regulator [Bacillus inaquosorum]|uniref:MerR family transcriptional regulator n=1 Tax=Bacillus inaquosorum TaxID=483913 RepID=UPI0022818036|nr:MerR family transcriptional regulator [Bacillus inaquosorum]MCY7901509.1 MerR family transcriptional regulator [Bacillus inaquosorum]MCY8261652.1 MerR family transcriptional regulator [Bacillus inaquosorum]MCY8283686.1 MerR family transcriptional regulator [Bacillus inaquosorum]